MAPWLPQVEVDVADSLGEAVDRAERDEDDTQVATGPGPLALFGTPAGGATTLGSALSGARSLGAKALGKRATAAAGADYITGVGPVGNQARQADLGPVDLVEGGVEAYEGGVPLDDLQDLAPDVADPDNWTPGWLQWLTSKPKWMITAVAGIALLVLLGPYADLASGVTGE